MNRTGNWRQSFQACLALILAMLCAGRAWADPLVTNVLASQRAGTKLVDVYYGLSGTGAMTVSMGVSSDGGATYAIAASSFSGDIGSSVTAGSSRHIVWNAGADWNGKVSSQMRFKVTASDAPSGMSLIPAGNFSMGDSLGDGYSDELPVHTVNVSQYYMDQTLVTYAQWQSVYTWAVAHGYGFDNAGSGKAGNHPVQAVDWYDCVKWSNARSEMGGLTPCYTVGGNVYRTGQSAPVCNLGASGYRLPTEAEWEKAARGGLSGQRFPWGNTIDRSKANYYVYSSNGSTNYFFYDLGTPIGYDPAYATGASPYTSPVGSFGANGYGLYDMAGNVWAWCWDWYGSYGSGAQTDPTGAASGTFRVLRGGGWNDVAYDCRVSIRIDYDPTGSYYGNGFRCVRR